jgi:GMP synthase (glutamine-hydrolysing)
MSSPRLLVIEGNPPESRTKQVAAGGVVASHGYSNLLRELLPNAIVDVCFPADQGANLPDGSGLESYDGIAITGSSLHIYERGPQIEPQIELVRTALSVGTPVFGSCWGLQLITVSAGGSVRRNPKGREIGFGRRIRLTEAGRKHQMYVGKVDVFNAPTVHLDEVETLPPGCTVLATNEISDVQSAEIKLNGATAWGVQYHPEYALREIAAIVRRIGDGLVDEGFFSDASDVTGFSKDLDELHNDPANKRLSWRYGISTNVLDKSLRTSEVRNWIDLQVLPMRTKRCRG